MKIPIIKKILTALCGLPLLLCLSQAAIAQGTLYAGTDNEEFTGPVPPDRLASTPVSGASPSGPTTLIPTTYPINGMGVSAAGNLLTGQPQTVGAFPGNTLRDINPVDGSINFSILAAIPTTCCNEENVFDGSHIWQAHFSSGIRKLNPDGTLDTFFLQSDVVGMALIGGQFWITKWGAGLVGTWDPATNIFFPVFPTPTNAGALAWDPAAQVLWVGQQGGLVTPFDLSGAPLGASILPFGAIPNTIDGLAFIPDAGDTVCVFQEETAGEGDYALKGQVSVFNRSGDTAADVFNYGGVFTTSYSPDLPFAPAAIADTTQLFFVDTSNGLSLFMVHDQPNDVGGGQADLSFTLSDDTAAILVNDDPGEPFTNTGGTQFDSDHIWSPCCTDGGVIGSLDGDWSMEVAATNFVGITNWQVSSANGPFVPLDLTLFEGSSKRVRLHPAPCDVVDLSKEIVEGPDRDNGGAGDGEIDAVIEVKQTATTEYVWKINYNNPGGPDVLITDTAPAESVVLAINGDDNGETLPLGCGEETSFDPDSGHVDVARGGKVGKNCRSSSHIDWTPSSDSEMLEVSVKMRQSPGKGHNQPAFAPTSCGPLYLNKGAQAFELDDWGEPLRDPVLESNQLCVAAVSSELLPGDGFGPDADHDGDGIASFAEACTNELRTNPCLIDTDSDGVNDDVDECPLEGLPNLSIGETLGTNGCIIPPA
jgi:hypothetical protein